MSPSGRRFLVFVRAGELSLHRGWLQNGNRNWDIVVSWYGSEPYEQVADEIVLAEKGWKWDVIARQLHEHPELIEQYDYFWFPDDDIDADAERISRMFELTETHGLAVSQPSLTPDSYFSFIHTLQSQSFLLRYAAMIEVMAPCLSKATLETSLPFFADVPAGAGLDWLWTRFEDDNLRKAALIDVVAMRHTRPVGGFLAGRMKTAGASLNEDQRALLARFGFSPGFHPLTCYAGIARSGLCRGRWATAVSMFLDYAKSTSRWVQPRPLERLLGLVKAAARTPSLTRVRLRD